MVAGSPTGNGTSGAAVKRDGVNKQRAPSCQFITASVTLRSDGARREQPAARVHQGRNAMHAGDASQSC